MTSVSKSLNKETELTHIHEALKRADDAIKAVLEGASHELDLTGLRVFLSEARDNYDSTYAPVETLRSELNLLKSDLVSRILTMTRAIEVALDKRNTTEEESALTDEVTNSPAETLLRLYRRACVRFRDTFPGNPRYVGAGVTARKDWSDFRSE